MKLLCVHPGASFSTHDVYVGLTEGLRERGHQIYEYALDGRIAAAGGWLSYCWKKGGKTLPQPTPADILYKAGCELVERALRIHDERDPLDWVLCVSAMYLHPDALVLMRRAGLRVAVLLTESPYDDDRQKRILPWVNLAWTNERSSARELGIGYVRHAYRPAVHHLGDCPCDDKDVPAHDVVFVGTAFQERIDLLSAVNWDGIDFALYGTWELLGSRHHLRKYLRGGAQDNPYTAALYRRAKVGLNLFRTSKGFGKDAPRIAHAESLGPRAYELAATGCFMLSEHRPEVTETFGDAVPTFTTPADLERLVRRWVMDPDGRARVKARLPGMVSGHTWDTRAQQIEMDLRGAGIGAGRAQHSLAGG